MFRRKTLEKIGVEKKLSSLWSCNVKKILFAFFFIVHVFLKFLVQFEAIRNTNFGCPKIDEDGEVGASSSRSLGNYPIFYLTCSCASTIHTTTTCRFATTIFTATTCRCATTTFTATTCRCATTIFTSTACRCEVRYHYLYCYHLQVHYHYLYCCCLQLRYHYLYCGGDNQQ